MTGDQKSASSEIIIIRKTDIMFLKKINAIEDDFQIAAVKTIKALEECQNQTGEIFALLSGKYDPEEFQKVISQKGFRSSYQKSVDHYTFTIRVGNSMLPEEDAAVYSCAPRTEKGLVVVASSRFMGEGDEKLGAFLMKEFFRVLADYGPLPEAVLFYNSGAYLTCSDSSVRFYLSRLEMSGVKIFTDTESLAFYDLHNSLNVGDIIGMHEIVDIMARASRIIKP